VPRFEVRPGHDGRWLVRDGGRLFLVPAEVGAPLAGRRGADRLAAWRELTADQAWTSQPGRGRSSVWLRVTLVPDRLVGALAARLRRLTTWTSLALLAGGGLAAIWVARGLAPPPASKDGPLGLLLFVATVLAHELGHAAALSREGWSPGAIGAGLLWVLPVAWCDVSGVTTLPRRGRVRVDLGGVAFQLAAAGAVALAAAALGSRSGQLAATGALIAVAWSLLPLIRTDGYWLACDLLGIEALEAPPPAGFRKRRVWLAALRVATAGALVGIVAAAPFRLRDALAPGVAGPARLRWVAAGTVAVLVAIGATRALQRAAALAAAAWRDRRT